MFEIYTSTTAAYTESQPITFTTIRHTDCRVINSGNNNFTIRIPGRYLIMFNGVGSSGTADGQFTIQLYKDGVAIPAVTTTITSNTANDPYTLGFNTLVDIRPSCKCINNSANLQLVVTSTAAGTVYSGDLIIDKVG